METYKFNTPIEVRFADLDAYGHVNNALFFTYLETARVKLFQQYFGAFLGSELMFLVVRAECDYRLPIELTDHLEIAISIDQVRHSSFNFGYRMHNGAGKIFAEAKTVMVCYDPKIKKPVAIPPEIKTFFTQE
ncbi:acyl-CoA thioester hydrolase [Desulfuromusa kysingii]|uniref:Acyl-CoA thioester hydrolase n=1 Tax=Desulfuromusa kysingii TaxID=37625 RepID=A0A1H3VKG8_9BACT|nr:thioesterase family protein [Desulfuromusa kysingii]SDZ74648.1 acyl-CoA thioester hydrolase [Desulfuromusa kysingii]